MRSRMGYLATAALLLFSISVMAQTETTSTSPQSTKPRIKQVAPIYTNPNSGRQMFDAYCASCHGQSGQGNGPAALALKTAPTDLTQLAAKNAGKFPEAHLEQVIKDDDMTAAHGSRDMPVWGPVFLYLSQHDPALAQLRIHNLARYVAALQQK